jgi:hypothetical protein
MGISAYLMYRGKENMNEREVLKLFMKDVNNSTDIDKDMKEFVNDEFPFLLKVFNLLRIPI